MLKNLQSTAILVANSFNVPIFTQIWLVENGVFSKDEFDGENLFSPLAVSVTRPGFNFLVVPERVQVRIADNFQNAVEVYTRTIGTISRTLPHTPLSAFGMNLDIFVTIDDADKFTQKLRELFSPNWGELEDVFIHGDERFGAYISQDIFDCRMKLDMKPVNHEGGEKLLLAFNFHKDISGPDDVQSHISNWKDIYEHAQKIAYTVNERMES